MSARTGPPEKEEGRTPCPGRPSTNDTSDHQDADTAAENTRRRGPLRARRAASDQLPVLDHLGRSDPWWYEPPGARGYEDAAAHLLRAGLLPAAHREGLQLMWNRGGACRQAAEYIAERWELAA
jgi:hypothetical protein